MVQSNDMFSKKEDLRKIDSAYQRVIISEVKYETSEFTQVVNNGTDENRRICIAEFIKTYQGNSLFIDFENILKYYDSKEALNIILSDMEYTDKSFFLYLYVPSAKLKVVTEEIETVYNHKKAWTEELFDKYVEDNYVVKIEDKRDSRSFNYLKIYPDGKVYVFVDSEFNIKREEFYLEEELKRELVSEIKKKVKIIKKNKEYLVCDDREFLKMFVLTYGFEWLGLTCEWGLDNKEYFLDEYPLRIIEKIMKLPKVKELFINVTKCSGVKLS